MASLNIYTTAGPFIEFAPPPLHLASDGAGIEHVPILVHGDASPLLYLASGGANVRPIPRIERCADESLPLCLREHGGALGKHRGQRRESDARDLVTPLDGGQEHDGDHEDAYHEEELARGRGGRFPVRA